MILLGPINNQWQCVSLQSLSPFVLFPFHGLWVLMGFYAVGQVVHDFLEEMGLCFFLHAVQLFTNEWKILIQLDRIFFPTTCCFKWGPTN
jgi:hypothetical protein